MYILYMQDKSICFHAPAALMLYAMLGIPVYLCRIFGICAVRLLLFWPASALCVRLTFWWNVKHNCMMGIKYVNTILNVSRPSKTLWDQLWYSTAFTYIWYRLVWWESYLVRLGGGLGWWNLHHTTTPSLTLKLTISTGLANQYCWDIDISHNVIWRHMS